MPLMQAEGILKQDVLELFACCLQELHCANGPGVFHAT